MAPQIRILFISLDNGTITTPREFPVDRTRVVTRNVFAMVDEFDRLLVVRARVQPGDHPFDCDPNV